MVFSYQSRLLRDTSPGHSPTTTPTPSLSGRHLSHHHHVRNTSSVSSLNGVRGKWEERVRDEQQQMGGREREKEPQGGFAATAGISSTSSTSATSAASGVTALPLSPLIASPSSTSISKRSSSRISGLGSGGPEQNRPSSMLFLPHNTVSSGSSTSILSDDTAAADGQPLQTGRKYRSDYMARKDAARSSLTVPSSGGSALRRSVYAGFDDDERDEVQDISNTSKASNIQETLNKLTFGTNNNNDKEHGLLDSLEDQQNFKQSAKPTKPTPPSSPSPKPETEYSPPRFLHHLAPDLEDDLSASRRAAVGPFSPVLDTENDDPLALFSSTSASASFGSTRDTAGPSKLIRKRMSNPLLGEPYYPNPNPVKGWTVGRERERERRKATGLGMGLGSGLGVFTEEQEESEVPRTPTTVGNPVSMTQRMSEPATTSPRDLKQDKTGIIKSQTSTMNSLSVAPGGGGGGRRKVSGSAFRNVILPPSDMVTSELKRQQQPASSSSLARNGLGSSSGKGKGIEETMAKLGIRKEDRSDGAAVQPLRTISTPRKTLVPNTPAIVSGGNAATAAKQTSLGLGRPSSSSLSTSSGLTVPSTVAAGGGLPSKQRIVSIGKTDGRVLGKHMPRIVSAQKRVVDESLERRQETTEEVEGRGAQVQGVPALSFPRTVHSTEPFMQAPATHSTARSSRVEEIRQGLIKKSLSLEREQGDVVGTGRDSVRSERSTGARPLSFDAQVANSPRPSWRDKTSLATGSRASDNGTTPASPIKRVVPDGRGMAGLTGKAVEAPLSPRPGLTRRQDSVSSVTGYGSRLRLSRGLPLSSSSVNLAPAPLPSKRLNTNWMDKQRKALVAYEYLCHVGEAQQWIEGCLGEELGWGVVEMEEEMRDGVALAKLVRVYEGDQVVKTIWEDKKHRFRQSDNINYFLNFVRSIGMPETFIFELTDLYDKKNMPKVIYCIHVLSHLLARLGKADKIGNLVGQFDFSDEQLAEAQRGLQGVAMPNFSSVGTALAKECNMEPEEEQETEEEARDRMLLECEPSIVLFQALLRGFHFRQDVSRTQSTLHLAEPSVLRFQSRARGALTRRKLCDELEERSSLNGMAESLQAGARGVLSRRRWRNKVEAVHQASSTVIQIQACARASLARVRMRQTRQTHLQASSFVTKLQAQSRGHIGRAFQKQQATHLQNSSVQQSLTLFQAFARGSLARRRRVSIHQALLSIGSKGTYSALQDQIRGVLLRKKLRTQVQTLDQATSTVIAIQSQARGALVRGRRENKKHEFESTSAAVVSLQALARARLARQSYKGMQKVFRKVEVTSSIGGLQALLRSRLAKKSTTEQKKRLDFVAPDVVGFQALSRGVLARREYHDWVNYLKEDETQAGITFLQQLLRGQMARRRLWSRLDYIYSNMHSIIKVQALWRGRKQREKYRKIVTGQHVDIAAIQNYMHLLDDSEHDFNEQVQIERMRKQVVDRIRTNQLLESQVLDLDKKIALILQNRLSFEDLVRVKGRLNTASEARVEDQTFNMARSDPFSHDAQLDKSLWHRRELYQRMFFILQTEPKYLARLLRLQTASDASEQDRRLLQSVILALYSYGQGRREEYLLLKMLQLAIHEQIRCVPQPEQLISMHLALTDVVLIFIRPNNGGALKAILSKPVESIVNARDLDLCIDPVSIYHRVLNDEESDSGVVSTKPRDVDANYAINIDPTSGAAFHQQLVQLQLSTNSVLEALYTHVESVPYALRCMARELLLALQVTTQYSVHDYDLAPIIARCLIMPYILPALTTPESQGIISTSVTALPRQNLQEVGKLVEAIATGRYRVPSYDVNMFATLEGYIQDAIPAFSDWILTLASVDDVESHLNTQELVEKSVEPKPITMTRAEIYAMHRTLMKEEDAIIVSESDAMRGILQELDGVPNVLYQEGQTAPVTFALSNRFAKVIDDPLAAGKADWVQAKRHILAVLRVQTGTTIIDILTAPVSEDDEWIWQDVIRQDLHRDQVRKRKSQLPPVPNQGNDYRLEDITSLPFREVKARAIQYCMKLEKQGLLDRSDDWQGLLDDIAGDIRSKNKNRQRRKKDYAAMSIAFTNSAEKKTTLEEQLASYNKYIGSAMDTMQKQGKKRFVWPLSKQHRHLRSMQKAGKSAKFGSFKYSASDLYEKHILLPSQGFSPKQFEKLFVILSSNEVGVFTMEIVDPSLSSKSQVLDSCEIRMEDLLQAKFENKGTLDLFDQVAKVRVNTLIFLINRKFYA